MAKQIKPLIKDYKAALAFLVKGKFDLKYTKSGSLSSESVGYLKGYFDFTQNEKLGLSMSVADLVGLVLDHYNIPISPTDLALYFRNERDQIKNNELRVHVVSEFHNAFERELAEEVIEECNPEVEEEPTNQDECERYIEDEDEIVLTPEQIQLGQDFLFNDPNFKLWAN